MKSKLISIDMRMIDASGIGTYLSNVVPIIIEDLSTINFNLIGDRIKLKPFEKYSNVGISNCESKIYTIKEQIKLINCIPKSTALFWSPHYNIPLFYRGKLLVTVHDVFHLAMTQYVSGIAKKIYSKLMFKALMYKADKILSVSQFTKDELLKYVGGNEEKIIVTHNGVNKKWFKDKNQDAIFNKPYILYVGNVKPHKNLSNLIRAFSKIENKIDHSLVIVGKKDGFITNDNDVQKLTEQHKDRIIFTGFVEDADLINYVQHTSLFVFPSLYEGFGLPPLEAMASGVPIAVSNIPPLREVCGKVACYFNPLDETDMAIKIYNALMTKVTAEEKERSIQQAKRYIWEDCALKTEKVIKELLK